MTLRVLERRGFLWSWGVVLLLLVAYFTVYYYETFSFFGPSLFGGKLPPPRPWMLSERTVLVVWVSGMIGVFTSFALMAVSLVHLWRKTGSSDIHKAVWTGIIVGAFQPGLLAYWIWNVGRPLLATSRRPTRGSS